MIALIVGIIFVAVGLVGLVLAILWPLRSPMARDDLIERFELETKRRGWPRDRR